MRNLIFCSSCRYTPDERNCEQGISGGEHLFNEMQKLLGELGRNDVTIDQQKCLWSCKRHCNVWLNDTEKFSYLAGDFPPTRESAETLLEWYDLHDKHEEGIIPFKELPQGIKGHFVARLPPQKDTSSA